MAGVAVFSEEVSAWPVDIPEAKTRYNTAMLRDLVRDHREEILRLAASHGAHNVRVFGSVARGTERPDSDVDILVDFEAGRSLLDHAGLLVELRDMLGRSVDVVPADSLHWFIREKVLEQAQLL
jgi:predicted nucleotidyltransferase